MNIKRERFTAKDIAKALRTSAQTVYLRRRKLIREGRIHPATQDGYTYAEVILIARMPSRHSHGRPPKPDKSELLRRQLIADGFINR